MKLPYVKVEFREEESFALGKVSWPLIFGFAVHWAWTYLMLSGPMFALFGVQSDAYYMVIVVCMATLCITMFSYAVFLQQARRLFNRQDRRNKIRLVGATLMAFGLLLAFAGGAGTVPVFVSGLFSGFGSAVLLMSYGVSFSVCDISTVSFSTAIALPLSAVVLLVIVSVSQMSAIVGVLLCLALPFVDFACLGASSKQLVDGLSFTSITMDVRPAPFFIHVFFPGLVFGFFLGVVRLLVFGEMPQVIGLDAFAQDFVLAGFFAGLMIFGAIVTQRQTNNFMFRTLLPVAAVLISSLYFVGAQSVFYTAFSLMTSFLMVEACMWVFLSDISQRFRISAFTVFGFGQGSFTLGSIAGFFFLPWVMQGSDQLCDFGIVMAIAFVAFVLGYSCLPKNAELCNTLKLKANCTDLWEDDVPWPNQAGGLERAAAIAGAAEEAHSPAQEPDQSPSAESIAQPADVSQSPVEGGGDAPEGEPASAVSPDAGSSGSAAVDAAPLQGDVPETGAVSRTMPVSADTRMSDLDEVESRLDEEERNQHRRAGRFKRKCAAVAETYLLSRKETEVLFLLAKGKNSAAIQEQLFISAGTANTHMRRIYRKLDIHSQQELMKLVEDTEVPDWDE